MQQRRVNFQIGNQRIRFSPYGTFYFDGCPAVNHFRHAPLNGASDKIIKYVLITLQIPVPLIIYPDKMGFESPGKIIAGCKGYHLPSHKRRGNGIAHPVFFSWQEKN
jgi:hypothetical protein